MTAPAATADPLSLLTVDGVAALAGVGRVRVLTAANSGELRGMDLTDPATHGNPNHKPRWRFTRADVADWIGRLRTGRTAGPVPTRSTTFSRPRRRVAVPVRHFR